LRFGHLPALLRSVYHLGLRGKERSHYWKLLTWTLFRRPVLLPMAVTLAVNGYHCRRICELYVV
jgi:hypothetical protein